MKNVKILGKKLSKNQQKEIAGGTSNDLDCGPYIPTFDRIYCDPSQYHDYKCISGRWVVTCKRSGN